MTGSWVRVSKANPCGVCGRPDWCGFSEASAVCMRVESPKPTANGGWLHVLEDRTDRYPHVRCVQVRQRRSDLCDLADQMQRNVTPARLAAFGAHLGVSADALGRLGVGIDERLRKWAFPMKDESGAVVGIRYRAALTSRKWSERGGREGLFLPRDLATEGPLFLSEGASDCAALLTLGLAAVGRPSCSGGVRYCAELARGRNVVVVGDLDAAGRRGAEALASTLTTVARTVRTIWPPSGQKDIRAAVRAGMTVDDLTALVAAAPIRALRTRFSHV